eukprot:8821435-Karenia_brevis.AAC.1
MRTAILQFHETLFHHVDLLRVFIQSFFRGAQFLFVLTDGDALLRSSALVIADAIPAVSASRGAIRVGDVPPPHGLMDPLC